MAMIDIARHRLSLLDDATALKKLPPELIEIIFDYSTSTVLDAVAQAALNPALTERIFVHFEDIFPEICARWILNTRSGPQLVLVAAAFARVLPFAPYLSDFLTCPTQRSMPVDSMSPPLQCLLPRIDEESTSDLGVDALLQTLFTAWRLLNFDFDAYRSLASSAYLQGLFSNENRAIRYVAIRIFCKLLHASDLKLEAFVSEHCGQEGAIMADLDGSPVDLGFLSLHEHSRVQKTLALRERAKRAKYYESRLEPSYQSLTQYVVSYGKVMLPRPHGSVGDPSNLVMTSTITENLQNLALLLREPNPVLLYGPSGAGKTALVHEIAKRLGMYANMVTLHLNEQTDAKMLVGLYSTSSRPNSFQWRPGVLTTAVREGRWVLIEDLDRAPTEVLSTLLPLIERRELLIPTRGETIRAAKRFRLFATIQTSKGTSGRENLPTLVGLRLWQSLFAQPLAQSELQDVVVKTYPILHKFVPGIIAVHTRLSMLTGNLSLMSRERIVVERQINLRDLLKWCRRLSGCLVAAGSTSGEEPISDITRDLMFMEALDCYVGSFPDSKLSEQCVYAIAEEMHVSKDRAEHFQFTNIPSLQETDLVLSIGRAQLQKLKASARLQKSKRPFASTTHAKRLLEQIAVAVKLREPVLLVGETGIGKTTVIQQLAESLGQRLIAVNLSQQSEAGDMLGGFKPVNVRSLAVPLKEEFEDLFAMTGISTSKNQKYLDQIGKAFAKSQWSRVSKLWKEAPKMFFKIVTDLERTHSESRGDSNQPAKRRKILSKLQSLTELRPRWDSFARNLGQFEKQIIERSGSFAFSFVEGNIVKAVRNGDWVLLDEINLASPDTLESIADLLTGPDEQPSILLTETGHLEKVVAHRNFRIFGAMNPATDVGKKDLPIGIRLRFTELYVKSPDADHNDLLTIVKTYLGDASNKHDQAANDITRLYLNTKRMAEEKRLVDGANEVPHFSLRTLTRVLSYVDAIAPLYGLRRALYEGFSMGFLTLLDKDSENLLLPLIHHHLLDTHGNPQSLLSQPPKRPNDKKRYVRFQNQSRDRQYWLFQGDQPLIERDDYIITPYVERNLLNLVRATSTKRFPILIQGPTSAGKTSMIEYLANFTGNKFVRINNHEHTDLQEYLGTYVSGPDGKLQFQEGLLVESMRKGHWIVLDELNLAPSDVLEALNRLLDDNHELLIPETQEVVRPHENFILFATQNPPGLYGGRKVLSRAFRNRFLELHFDDIPEDELEYILQHRSRQTAPSDCKRIVTVYKALSRLRQTSRVFEKKGSFATLRDLFRWALRTADTREELAAQGFMLLAERVRDREERLAVKEVIERVFNVNIKPEELYAADIAPELKRFSQQSNDQGVVWTQSMRRLYVLVSRALRNNEPVLLVGETGCGKTTVCQLLAEAFGKQLRIVNAHQNTETGDIIGSQRPVRNRGSTLSALENNLMSIFSILDLIVPGSTEQKLAVYKSLDEKSVAKIPPQLAQRVLEHESRAKALFEWTDGALVEAMRNGQFFLLDEISLTDDSVLERLNSLLEAQRTLLLAEMGNDNSLVVASYGFQFFATMNPGGDFGKKELSPALRNRFTEIWVPPLSESDDIHEIVRAKLVDSHKHLVDAMVNFAVWFGKTFRQTATTPFSVREVLAWVQFVNGFGPVDTIMSLVHGASAIFIDSIGANPSAMFTIDPQNIDRQRQECLAVLGRLVGRDVSELYGFEPEISMNYHSLTIGDFSVARSALSEPEPNFAFHAPTTKLNVMRVVRAFQLRKPILLEGSPGVGKTSLVAALSRACGRPLTRINLSDQTDLMDLFGTDVPIEGEEAGKFAWRDAPFLRAMQRGEWVLLDEMNLASQSVLEGLNACLDHRGEVYISELDQIFKCHPEFRLFAAQNPHHQGGGRKGLPASFVNRFITVFADAFKVEDLKFIVSHNFPNICHETTSLVIDFILRMDHQLTADNSFGLQGGPWEFNLRDVLRWLGLLSSSDPLLRKASVGDFLDIIVRQRFRTEKDRDQVGKLFSQLAGRDSRRHSLYHDINPVFGQVGLAILRRNTDRQCEKLPNLDMVNRLPELESLMICVEQNVPCILSSPAGFGKSALLTFVAALAGKPLVVFPMNADVDTMDLVGGFEQADPLREVNTTLKSLHAHVEESVMSMAPAKAPFEALHVLHLLDMYSGDGVGIEEIRLAVECLQRLVMVDSDLGQLLQKTQQLLQEPTVLSDPKFEWLDGVIVKALKTGQWLVLDHANMCNASVLDRLNSLFEPSGYLCINEHCDPDGNPKVIKPHPDFRVFLTMDPRHGELSRAMRNRAVEVHICAPPPCREPCLNRISEVESGLQRYQDTIKYCHHLSSVGLPPQACRLASGYLSMRDISLLPRLVKEVSSMSVFHKPALEAMNNLMGFLQSASGSNALRATQNMYSDIPRGIMEHSNAQPINPLKNSLVSQLTSKLGEPQWSGLCFEFSSLLYDTERMIEAHCRDAVPSKPTSLTRLQRSYLSSRVAGVSKDPTVKLHTFLSAVVQAMHDYLGHEPSSSQAWKERLDLCCHVTFYIEQTVALSTRDTFDEARFQAHLTLGRSILNRQAQHLNDRRSSELVRLLLSNFESSFRNELELSTGLSMELLWHVLRPPPIPDKSIFERSLELHRLAAQFDSIRWKTTASIADLSNAHKTLEQAYRILRTGHSQANDLVKDLSAALDSLESRIVNDEAEVQPFFSREFEYLRQFALLRVPAAELQNHEQRSDLAVLSGASTKATMLFDIVKGHAALIQSIDCLAHQGVLCWDGKLTTCLWQKLQSVHTVSLRSLNLLESELPVIGHCISELSADVVVDPIHHLNGVLLQLLSQIFIAHDPQLDIMVALARSQALRYMDSILASTELGLSGDDQLFSEILRMIDAQHLRQISEEYFVPAIMRIVAAERQTDRRAVFSALAWIQVSVGLLKLYVPDRVCDPQLRPLVEQEFLKGLQTELQQKKSSLQVLERSFSGQDTSMEIELLEHQLLASGPPPEAIQSIFRPEVSTLDKMHSECLSVLKITTGSSISSVIDFLKSASSINEAVDVIKLMKLNVQGLLDRFKTGFEAYQDITGVIVNTLQCFLVGLSLCDVTAGSELQNSTKELANMTPFLGVQSWKLSAWKVCKLSFEHLNLASSIVAVEGIDALSANLRESIFKCFHSFYEDWSKKLDAERKIEEAKTSMYRFRGSVDDEEIDEMEFNELFPNYEDESASMKRSAVPNQVRSTSLRVAEAHKKIFLQRLDPLTAIRETCMAVSQRITDETQEFAKIDCSVNERLLTMTTLLLSEKLEDILLGSVEKSSNFYTDTNLVEARQLATLAQKVKRRFQELQRVDEIGHMKPLADVVQSCDALLNQTHSEPLAKLILKLEQVHAFVYEWQFGGWASKIYAVLPLHNALTDTIIRWRRLELSTWANLFDMEQEKCQDDAYSWWFIAYQVVIAVPLSLLESAPQLDEYATALLQSLELYFAGSIIGQFKTRLTLLRQLLSHLRLLSQDYPTLRVIHDAVKNFIEYYSRFQTAADAAIKKGRISIETKMKDVLLMASWKDTNISALRESARKSHQKLFRLVRKFRIVLGQEMKTIVEQVLPDDAILPEKAKVMEISTLRGFEIQSSPLTEALPGWLDNHRRLANVATTTSVLEKTTQKLMTSKNVAQVVDDFTSSLTASIAELQRETPSTLTEETKIQVKHLKTRKRKLLADTLRGLRMMGLQFNLAQDKLVGQESLAIVLASAASVEYSYSSALLEADYLFHKTLDLAPKVRATAREHSDDLTGAEVGRCIGFVEGLINFTLSQRGRISAASRSLFSLHATIKEFERLGNVQKLGKLVRRQRHCNWDSLLPWLSQIIHFAQILVRAHGKLGQTDVNRVTQKLQDWRARVDSHLAMSTDMGKLQILIFSEAHLQLEADVMSDMEALRSDLSAMIRDRPDLSLILGHILTWTHSQCQELSPQLSSADLKDCADSISTLVDSTLVAVENVKKLSESLFIEEDQAGWLRRNNDTTLTMTRQLHMIDVDTKVRRCIKLVQQVNLNEPAIGTAVMSFIRLATPILGHFCDYCRVCVDRGVDLHRATLNMAYKLTKTFSQIASKGFCTPQEKSDEKSGDENQLEPGTGLGEGEGVEDISKDIQADEDLTELAQQADQNEKAEIEGEKDAVDMADQDLEGELGSIDGVDDEERNSQDDQERENEDSVDEEAGEVDDLDPTAVDEKMWDGDQEKAEKDQKGNQANGNRQDDEQLAAEEIPEQKDTKRETNDVEVEKKSEAEESAEDVSAKEEVNRQDQNVDQSDALELPQEMDLGIENQVMASSDDDDLDAMSDIEDRPENEERPQENDVDDMEADETANQQLEIEVAEKEGERTEPEQERDVGGDEMSVEVKSEPEQQSEEEAESKFESEEQAEKDNHDDSAVATDTIKADEDNAALSEVKSSGLDQSADSKECDEQFQAETAQQDEGKLGQSVADQDTNLGRQEATGRPHEPVGPMNQEDHDSEDARRSNPFRKLGDALEKWHRQQMDIQEAASDGDEQNVGQNAGVEQRSQEFQHLRDDETAADTQAMGTAGDEEALPIDESMAIEEDGKDTTSHAMETDEDDGQAEIDRTDMAKTVEREEKIGDGTDQDRSGVTTKQGNYKREASPAENEVALKESEKDQAMLEEASVQLSGTHIAEEQRPLRGFAECVRQWADFESKSHALSLSLTSQLRLILTPSQSTKLSGGFRTGKRLNMKRIIPYIASSYKRDKIWMRRSVPTKRRYQILVCVDDSKSMGESSAGALALEALVMVCRSLAMLEAGQVGVMGFGSDAFTAHELTAPLAAAEAGARVLQKFSFGQERTDMAQLVQQTMELFRTARRQQSGAGSELWQLALILSDGLTPSSAHDSIRRLLREAMEERIMVVFIIMDDSGSRRGDSVLELKEAKFVRGDDGESRVLIERYLDSFPFPYYLIVHNVDELPSALAGLLRTWFAEVAS